MLLHPTVLRNCPRFASGFRLHSVYSLSPILTSPHRNISYSASVLADARVSDGPSLLLLTNQRLLLAHVDAHGNTCVKWLAWEHPQSAQTASTSAMSAAPELDVFCHPFLSSSVCHGIDWSVITAATLLTSGPLLIGFFVVLC